MVMLLNGISNTLSTSIDLENFTIAAIPPFSVLKTIHHTWRSWTGVSVTFGWGTAKPQATSRVVNPDKIVCSHNPWTAGSLDPKPFTATSIAISYVKTWASTSIAKRIVAGQPVVRFEHVLQADCASLVYCCFKKKK